METEKTFKTEKQQKLNVLKIILEADKTNKFLMRVVFTLDDATRLTYKPTYTKSNTQLVRGLEVVNTSEYSYEIQKTPEKIFKINDLLNKFGSVAIVTDLNEMTVTDEITGESKVYKFLNKKNFEELVYLDNKGKVIIN
jgi:hypothetical protein